MSEKLLAHGELDQPAEIAWRLRRETVADRRKLLAKMTGHHS